MLSSTAQNEVSVSATVPLSTLKVLLFPGNQVSRFNLNELPIVISTEES